MCFSDYNYYEHGLIGLLPTMVNDPLQKQTVFNGPLFKSWRALILTNLNKLVKPYKRLQRQGHVKISLPL